MSRTLSRLLVFPGIVCFASLQLAAIADEPLHRRIDKLLDARVVRPVAAPCTDEEFLRRIYLDLIGRIPSTAEAQRFLNDQAPDKRATLIESLLASEEHPYRMSDAFHVMLMERLGEHEEWNAYLFRAFQTNKPWDQVARELTCPDPDDEENRGSAFFITKRLEKYGQNPTDYPGLVRDVGRLFLGVDLQCAQCHDHLFVDDYKQVDYQGLYAFLGQTTLRTDLTFPAVAEQLVAKKVDFKSVFIMEDRQTGPRLPGAEEVKIPAFAKGEEYEVPPDRKTRFPGKPKFSPLRALSEQLPDHPLFRANIANRLWWLTMGRGLVHPLDLHHSDNPASHPELLDLLGDELAAHDYDLRWLLREIALTEAYQRSSILPDGADADETRPTYQVALEKPMSTEQLMLAMLQATGNGSPPRRCGDATDGLPGWRADEGAMKELRERFESAFANPPREPEVDHNPSVKAALFLLNDDVVLGWLKPQPGNLVDRLTKAATIEELAEELYVTVLTRRPTDGEQREVADYLAAHEQDREAAIGNLVWALLASAEFCVNH